LKSSSKNHVSLLWTFCPAQVNVTRANTSVQFAEFLGVIAPFGLET